MLQDHTQYLLMAAIGLELAGAVLFLLDSSLGALLLVKHSEIRENFAWLPSDGLEVT